MQTCRLTPPECKILELKYRSRRIGEMSHSEVSKWSKALLAKIHVITGWTVPENELLTILIDQFEKKLVEDYCNVNPDEIEYAFRSEGTQVKDWGKSMNLSLIDQVMLPYLEKRSSVSLIEEREIIAQKTLPPSVLEISDEEITISSFKIYKLIRKYELLPVCAYEFLTSTGRLVIPADRKADIKVKITKYISLRSQEDADFANDMKSYGDLTLHIKSECKKYAVGMFFEKLIDEKKELL